jgi:hypothetical protein
MKTILVILLMATTTSVFAGQTESVKMKVKKITPDNTVVRFNDLRNKMADVSMLKPVFMVLNTIEAMSVRHRKSLMPACNKNHGASD